MILISGSSASAQIQYLLSPDQIGSSSLEFPPDVIVLESSFNADPNFEPLSDFTTDNRYRKLGRSIGRLDVIVENRLNGSRMLTTCTATIISEVYILTNYHCVPGMDGNEVVTRAILKMGYLDKFEAPGELYEVSITPVEAVRELDYAVLRVEGNPSSKYGFIPLQVRDPELGEELFIVHHPEGDPQRLTRRNCRLMSSPAAITNTQLRHRCDTKGGSSGSLIFSDNYVGNSFSVVGLHFAGFKPRTPDPYNSAKRLTTILGQSSVLRQIANNATATRTVPTTLPSDQPKPKIILMPPSAFSNPAMPVADDAPVFTAQIKQENFKWAMGQILAASKKGFEPIKDYDDHFITGVWSSKVNLPQYATTPNDNCSVHNESTLGSTKKWTSCFLGSTDDYALIARHVRAALPVFTTNTKNDMRGIATQVSNGPVVCLEQGAATVASLLGGPSRVRLTVWSTDSTAPSCFSNPPLMMN